MRIHRSLALLLIVCLPVRAAGGQQPPPGSLQQAERAFADALAKHDRGAFVAMFASDAESTLPSISLGPEAIANAWLPFLIDRGTTMILTSTEVVAATAGDTGTSSGTFAIRGRTKNGVETASGGTYSLRWRLLDGRWTITSLSGSGNGARRAADNGGIGPFRFGMTSDEVSRVPDCEPYTRVALTGGLECPDYRFDDREMNISFIFAGDHLRRIQLWYYEGESSVEAREAVGRILAFLQRTTGGAIISARPDVPATADGVISAINAAPAPRAKQIAQLEICGRAVGRSDVWFARVGRHEHGYLVMLFAEAAGR